MRKKICYQIIILFVKQIEILVVDKDITLVKVNIGTLL